MILTDIRWWLPRRLWSLRRTYHTQMPVVELRHTGQGTSNITEEQFTRAINDLFEDVLKPYVRDYIDQQLHIKAILESQGLSVREGL